MLGSSSLCFSGKFLVKSSHVSLFDLFQILSGIPRGCDRISGQLGKAHDSLFKVEQKNLGDFPGGPVVKDPPANTGDAGDRGSVPGSEMKKWQTTSVFLPVKSHRQRSLSPWGSKESDRTERLSPHIGLTSDLFSRMSWRIPSENKNLTNRSYNRMIWRDHSPLPTVVCFVFSYTLYSFFLFKHFSHHS